MLATLDTPPTRIFGAIGLKHEVHRLITPLFRLHNDFHDG
jgi:hypothetical protein